MSRTLSRITHSSKLIPEVVRQPLILQETVTISFTGSPSWTTETLVPTVLTFSGTGQYLSVSDPSSGGLDIPDGSNCLYLWLVQQRHLHRRSPSSPRKTINPPIRGYIIYIDDTNDDLCLWKRLMVPIPIPVLSTSTFTSTGWHSFTVTWNRLLPLTR